MRRILKLNGEGILNFRDLQRQFSVWELYRQRLMFADFARVHCQPLPTLRVCEETGKVLGTLCYLDKEFWMSLLTAAKLPEVQDAGECLRFILREMLLEAMGITGESENTVERTTQEECAEEYRYLQLDEKLSHIERVNDFGKSKEDAHIALILLAICEISEMDARKVSFLNGRETEAKQKAGEEICLLEGGQKIRYLDTRAEPYRFWYYASGQLAEGEKIQTVRMEAKSVGNRYVNARIELYSDADGSLVHAMTLFAGEFRYCNHTEGRIIKFLPTVSISDNLALIRENYAKNEITVFAPGTEKWRLTEDFSCFAAGPGRDGFLGISAGKVNASCYQPLKDYMARLKLDLVTAAVVEVKIGENGYELLTEDGLVISERQKKALSSHVASLTSDGRFPISKKTEDQGVLEVAVSFSGRSMIKHRGSKKKALLCFGE